MAPEFKYDVLTPEERAAAIRSRLQGLERDHFNASLDVRVAGEQGNPAQVQRVAELGKVIDELRAELNSLGA